MKKIQQLKLIIPILLLFFPYGSLMNNNRMGSFLQNSNISVEQDQDFPSDDPLSASEETLEIESFLIITVDDFVSLFEELTHWKEQKGLPSYIETIANIEATYDGIKIIPRNGSY
ncbi:MAG: hypothetical protein ACTSPA_08950 [Promethearchaeota archaeon]